MTTLSKYIQTWRLKFSHSKTLTTVFHVSNREAKRELKVYYNNKRFSFCSVSIYLGVKLHKLLGFCHHLAQKTIFALHSAEATGRLRMGCWCQNTAYSCLISILRFKKGLHRWLNYDI